MGSGPSHESAKFDASAKPLFIGANWKCSAPNDGGDIDKLVDSSVSCVLAAVTGVVNRKPLEIVFFPPYIFIERVVRALDSYKWGQKQTTAPGAPWSRGQQGVTFSVGGQNVAGFAATGEVPPAMLKAAGCKWVLLGHSDRRNTIGETDELIAGKAAACLEAGLHVNLTIGEKLEAREAGKAIPTLIEQLSAGVSKMGTTVGAWSRLVVAYEPVWAVGEGATPCSPKDAHEVLSAMRGWVRDNVGAEQSEAFGLVYTGSVNVANAGSYAGMAPNQGFVVGRAGLKPDLGTIARTLSEVKAGEGSKL